MQSEAGACMPVFCLRVTLCFWLCAYGFCRHVSSWGFGLQYVLVGSGCSGQLLPWLLSSAWVSLAGSLVFCTVRCAAVSLPASSWLLIGGSQPVPFCSLFLVLSLACIAIRSVFRLVLGLWLVRSGCRPSLFVGPFSGDLSLSHM